MRLIWLSHFIPFPPKGGNLQRSYNLIRQASLSCEITLVALNFHRESVEDVRSHARELEKYCDRVEIWELPYPWRSSRWLVNALASPAFRVPFSCRALFSKSLLSRWEKILREQPGALIHFDSIDLALFASAANGFRKVLNHHNCESALAFRRARGERNPVKKMFIWLQARKLLRLEKLMCADFDTNLAVSDEDAALLHDNQPSVHTHVVANGVDTHYFVPLQSEIEPRTLTFTGLLNWYPNISGLRFFIREVWPVLKSEFPDVRLCVAGKNPVKEVLEWPKKDRSIIVIPNPNDMRPVLARSSIVICPLLEGGGTRLKILDAMAMGKPVISTSVGCEGLRIRGGENILIADSARQFADAVTELFGNDSLIRHLSAAGRALVEREYCWEKIGQELDHAYACSVWNNERVEYRQRRLCEGNGPVSATLAR